VVITVDLTAQTLSVFRGGYEIGATAILYGDDAKPTPLGVYPITQKKKDHISNLYNAPMPYMQRLTNDGISIHGSKVEWGYATHGCIGVPLRFAELLFGVTRLGDRVIVTDGKRLGMGERIIGH
jgi:lipoprotein-anchoring transpeptidase ErfK/SrfK